MTSSDRPFEGQTTTSPTSSPTAPRVTAVIGEDDRATWLVPGIFLVLPLIWVVAYFIPPINQDVAVVLSITERWMSGERLYLDVIDVNPPLIFMLNAIPVALAKVVPISTVNALMLCVLALSLWSSWVSYRLLGVLAVAEESTARLLLLPLLLFTMVVFPSEMFAQREHFMALGMVPYFLLAAARCEGRSVSGWLAASIALVAALGFALKPHFLIIPAAVELYVLFVRRSRAALLDPVPWILAAVMAAYTVIAWLFMPAYFNFVVPLVMGSYESIGGTNYLRIVTGRHLLPYLFVLVPLTFVAFRMRWPHAARLTGIAGLAAAIAGVAQDKGWPYHLLPTQMAAILMFGWAVARLSDRLQQGGALVARHGRSMIALILLLIYCMAGSARYTLYDQMDYEGSQAGQWQKILAKYASGASVLMITPGIYPHFPAMNYVDIKQASRFLTVWPLQGAYESCKATDARYRSPAQMTDTERLYGQMLTEDLVRNRPKLVVIDKIPGIPWCGGKEFDFIEYFTMQPAFAAEWTNYQYVAIFDRYLLYVRKPVTIQPLPPVLVAP